MTRICLLADLTLMLAWSPEEAGKIVETYKIFENKPPTSIMEREDENSHQNVSLINKNAKIQSTNYTYKFDLFFTINQPISHENFILTYIILKNF